MKKLLLFACIAFMAISINTKAQNTQWAKHIGGADNNETAIDLKTDTEGNLYILGRSKGSVDFDPSESILQLSSETFTPFIAKYSPDGELIWAGQLGSASSNYSEAFAMTLDENNNIYLTGIFTGTVDFDLSFDDYELTSQNNYDMFVLKLSSNGVFVWAKAFDGALSGSANPLDIAVKNDEIYVAGYFDYTIQFNAAFDESEHSSFGKDDVFLLQLDNNGEYVWSYTDGSEEDDRALGIEMSSNGDVFITGYHEGEMDFGPGVAWENVTGSGTFIVKYLNSGVVGVNDRRICDWTLSFGAQEGANIALDAEDNVYVTGTFGGSVNFNPLSGSGFYLTAPSYPDIYLTKISGSRQFQWALTPYTYDTDGGIFPEDLSIDSQGNIYITGQHSDDIFVKKYSPEGEQIYGTKFNIWGEQDWDNTGYGIAPADNNTFYLIADFEETHYFNEDQDDQIEITAFGGKDLVLVKHDTDEAEVGIENASMESTMSIYPNPSKDFISISENIDLKNIQIVSMDGRIHKTTNSSSIIDVSNLSSGIYFLKFELNNQTKSIKFIKE
ncbi:MAG: T9SS type A sorting domain-containing protein [Salinivirgaceae bacterium]|nr:T9SS type A sorting domain-containing protein [Salinivirgaceae bacterium]